MSIGAFHRSPRRPRIKAGEVRGAGVCANERRIGMTTNTTTHPRRTSVACAILVILTIVPSVPPALAAGGALVSVGSPSGQHPQNAQNEPALAVHANHP